MTDTGVAPEPAATAGVPETVARGTAGAGTGRVLRRLLPHLLALGALVYVGLLLPGASSQYSSSIIIGDEGAEAYAADLVNRGQRMFRDIPYSYGPLMPYYHAASFRVLGTSLRSLRLGWVGLQFVAFVLLYALLAGFMRPAGAALLCLLLLSGAGCWVFPRYEYNHVGCLIGVFGAALLLAARVRGGAAPSRGQVVLAGVCLALAMCVKLNMAVAWTVALGLWLVLAGVIEAWPGGGPQRRRALGEGVGQACLLGAVAVLLAAAVYLFFLHAGTRVPLMRFFPYQAGQMQHPPISLANLSYLAVCARYEVLGLHYPGANTVFLLWLAGALPLLGYLLASPPAAATRGALLFWLLATTGAHEHVLRAASWNMFPWNYLPALVCLGLAACCQPPAPRAPRADGRQGRHSAVLVRGILVLLALLLIGSGLQRQRREAARPWQPIPGQRAGVLALPDDPEYLALNEALAFIARHCTADERLAAFPYAPLLPFLSGHELATTEYMFVELTDVEPGLQDLIVRELAQQRPRYLFLSNFAWSAVEGMGGRLGVTYGHDLARVIREQYRPLQTFGRGEFYGGWDRGEHLLRVYGRRDAELGASVGASR